MSGSYRDDPILLDLLDYWERKRGARPMPARRDIDPTEIPKLLPHIRITEIVDGGARFRYRLVGTAIVDAHGEGFTGKHTDEIFTAERRDYIEGNYRLILECRRPLYLRSRYVTPKNLDVVARRLLAPLSSDGTTIDMVIAAVTFEAGPLGRDRVDATAGPDAALDLAANHCEIL